jgi:hypothetical protein
VWEVLKFLRFTGLWFGALAGLTELTAAAAARENEGAHSLAVSAVLTEKPAGQAPGGLDLRK